MVSPFLSVWNGVSVAAYLYLSVRQGLRKEQSSTFHPDSGSSLLPKLQLLHWPDGCGGVLKAMKLGVASGIWMDQCKPQAWGELRTAARTGTWGRASQGVHIEGYTGIWTLASVGSFIQVKITCLLVLGELNATWAVLDKVVFMWPLPCRIIVISS